MRALVVAGSNVEVAERPDPTPAPGEVVVRVSACGICGSDVHAVSDRFAADGQVLGHEISAVVASVGADAGPWVEGTPVAVNPIGSCGQCAACRRQLPFLCQQVPNVGISAAGGFAEYLAVPAAQLIALPIGLEPWVGSRAEPLAVALRAVELAGLTGRRGRRRVRCRVDRAERDHRAAAGRCRSHRRRRTLTRTTGRGRRGRGRPGGGRV